MDTFLNNSMMTAKFSWHGINKGTRLILDITRPLREEKEIFTEKKYHWEDECCKSPWRGEFELRMINMVRYQGENSEVSISGQAEKNLMKCSLLKSN